jgi:HSP20 family molecular chaperone IbpA
MKNRDFLDLRELMDEIFEAAEGFRKAVEDEMGSWKETTMAWGEHRDYYPGYSYPPMNVFITSDKSLVFEFALAGFSEDDISLQFRGDYLYFSAKAPAAYEKDDSIRFFKRRLKFKDIQEQKYFVPEDKFNRDEVRAVFTNSILTVTIPPKDQPQEKEGIRVTIVSDGTKKKPKAAEKTGE